MRTTPVAPVGWDENGHGDVNFLWGVAYSCDIYWYKVGGGYEGEVENGGLGPWRIAEYARAIGYGTLTGIELPGETEGLIPDPTWKRVTVGENWSIGDTYIYTMGQGYVLATPLQVLNSISTIANGGHLMEITLVDKITEPDGYHLGLGDQYL
jgi:penicillin-binding protein 2